MMVNWAAVGQRVKEEATKPGSCRCVCRCSGDAKYQVKGAKGILPLCKDCYEEWTDTLWKP